MSNEIYTNWYIHKRLYTYYIYIYNIYIYIKFGRLKKFKSNKVTLFGMSLKAHGLTALTWLNFLPRWESPSYVKFKLNESTSGQMISPSHHWWMERFEQLNERMNNEKPMFINVQFRQEIHYCYCGSHKQTKVSYPIHLYGGPSSSSQKWPYVQTQKWKRWTLHNLERFAQLVRVRVGVQDVRQNHWSCLRKDQVLWSDSEREKKCCDFPSSATHQEQGLLWISRVITQKGNQQQQTEPKLTVQELTVPWSGETR